MIINYYRKTFIVQATGGSVIKLLMAVSDDLLEARFNQTGLEIPSLWPLL